MLGAWLVCVAFRALFVWLYTPQLQQYGAELRHRRERERAAAEESAKLLMHEASGTALAGMGAHAHVM